MTIKQQLNDLMIRKPLNQAQVARAISCSPATLSQYLQGKYAGNVKAVETKIEQFIHRETERARPHHITIPFVLTQTVKKGLELIAIAHEAGDINILYGEAGLGKTSILKEYFSKNAGVLLIEVDPSYTAKYLLEDLCNQLNLSSVGNLHELTARVIGKLKDSGRLILVDEAELLALRPLEVLRRIHDKTGVGVVMAGMPRLIVNLKGKHGELGQLYSRVAFAHNLGNALPREDIDAIVDCIIPDIDDRVSNAFFTESKGNARRLSRLLHGTSRLCRINDIEVNADAIKEYSKALIN